MELHRNVWVPFLLPFGVPFSPFRSLGLLSAGRFRQKGDLEGVEKRGQKRKRTLVENGAILGSISMHFRGRIAKRSFLKKCVLHKG